MVDDEWTRELESEEDLDLLFVAYDPRRATIDDMMETIGEQGFTARVKEESAPDVQVKQEG